MLKTIRCVEIEIHSYCNRKCNWCPNQSLLRNKKIELSEKLYIKILNELKENGFKGVISYSRYNEPLADMQLLNRRLKQAKKILPNIKLVTNTNGDYIDNINLDDMLIDDLSIMDYDCIGVEQCKCRLQKLGASIININYPYILASYKSINIIYYIDWPKNSLLIDRGGFFKKDIFWNNKKLKWSNERNIRKSICNEPKYFIGIDFNGNVTPCCQIRSDNKNHKNYILGNIEDSRLTEIFFSNKAKKFRKLLSSNNFKQYPDVCRYCNKASGRYTKSNPTITF